MRYRPLGISLGVILVGIIYPPLFKRFFVDLVLSCSSLLRPSPCGGLGCGVFLSPLFKPSMATTAVGLL